MSLQNIVIPRTHGKLFSMTPSDKALKPKQIVPTQKKSKPAGYVKTDTIKSYSKYIKYV